MQEEQVSALRFPANVKVRSACDTLLLLLLLLLLKREGGRKEALMGMSPAGR